MMVAPIEEAIEDRGNDQDDKRERQYHEESIGE